MVRSKAVSGVTSEKAVANLIKALGKGVLKVMSQDGHLHGGVLPGGAGLRVHRPVQEVIDAYFTGTTSRLGGVGLDVIAREVEARHRTAYPVSGIGNAHRKLATGGEYQWRREGEPHLFDPETVFRLQHSTRARRYDLFKHYTHRVDDQAKRLMTLRGLFEFDTAGRSPIPLEEVEPVSRDRQAVLHRRDELRLDQPGGARDARDRDEPDRRASPTPARAARTSSGCSTRRGAARSSRSPRADSASPALYLTDADDIQIKMAQGAKPGEGGQLPGAKVYPWVARTRHSTPGVGLISPPPHHDIYSIEDLAQLIHDLKNANPSARIHVKLVSEVGVGTVAAGVSKAHADVVLISGSRRRHRRLPADLAQARGRPVGARARRDPADAGAQRPARPDRRADRRPAQDRPRRRHRRAARRGGVRLRHRPAGGQRLHHDARLPPGHLPGRASPPRTRSCGPGSAASRSSSRRSSSTSPKRSASSSRRWGSARSPRPSAGPACSMSARRSTTGRPLGST